MQDTFKFTPAMHTAEYDIPIYCECIARVEVTKHSVRIFNDKKLVCEVIHKGFENNAGDLR